MTQDILAIIPARGGSKRLPRKNIKRLCGKPLIYYTIDAAFKSRNIDRVIVSTDDMEISDVAVNYGVEVIERPKALSQDDVSTEDVVLHVLDREKAKIVVCLQPTSPLRTTQDIDRAIEMFLEGEYKSVISYCGKNPNGAIYITTPEHLIKHKNFFSGRIGYYQMPRKRSVDIDTLEDFENANVILNHRRSGH